MGSRPPFIPPTMASSQIDNDARFFGEENVGFYTDILTSADPNDPMLDDLNFPFTQGTQCTSNALSDELQADVVESQTTEVVAAGRRAKKGASHRQKKFDNEEDKVICAAWLNVSKDPINGANQGRSTFWGRIREYFDEHKDKKTSVCVRTENSIMHRWRDIQRDVNKFCSVYEKIERRNASGTTIQDMVKDALEAYVGVDEDHRSFTLTHCWHKLKDEDKWKALRIELAQKNKKQKTTKESTTSNVQARNNGDTQEAASPASEEPKRPKGQKQVKQAMRDDASLAALQKMMEKKEARDLERDKAREASIEVERAALDVERAALEASLELEKKRLANEEKKIEADLFKEEREIMLADKTSLDEEQLQWLEIMKKKILARHRGN